MPCRHETTAVPELDDGGVFGAGRNRKRIVNDVAMLQRSPRRHPFRSRLSQERVETVVRVGEDDLKLFAVSFTAFFICFYTFLL